MTASEERLSLLPPAGSCEQPLMVRTFLKVYMELGSYFLFLQEQIKDIIIIGCSAGVRTRRTTRRAQVLQAQAIVIGALLSALAPLVHRRCHQM